MAARTKINLPTLVVIDSFKHGVQLFVGDRQAGNRKAGAQLCFVQHAIAVCVHRLRKQRSPSSYFTPAAYCWENATGAGLRRAKRTRTENASSR